MPKLRVQAQVKRSYNVDFEMEVDDDTLIQPETLDHVIKQAISHEISYGITEKKNILRRGR